MELKITEKKPRIILMVNDMVGFEVTKFLIENKEHIVAIFFHEKENQKWVSDILSLVNWVMSSDDVYLADILKTEKVVPIIESYRPDVIITCYWTHLLKKEIIDIPKYGCINFHPALLPKNRGWYPAIWPFIDGSKAGVTLHLIDEGADTGLIIAQEEIDVDELDTLGSVYLKSQVAMISLFKKTWRELKSNGVELKEQDHSQATYHTKKEGNALNEIDLDRQYKAGDFINLIKSRMFNGDTFAYYRKNGSTYKVRINIEKE